MDEHQLRCFLAIAELGSVSRAAARIDIAQPTLSTILTSAEVVAKITAALQELLKDPKVTERFASLGVIPALR